MRAFRVYGARQAQYETIPDPTIGPEDALIRVRAVAVCGTDLEIYQGTMFYFTSGLARYPIIPGHEWSGEVLAVGSEVRGIKPGDKVVGECTVACGHCEYCQRGWYNQCTDRREAGILNLDGAYAERMVYPAAYLHRFSNLSFEEAALCETTAIAVYAVKLVETNPADYVAILGSGPIGLQAMQAAKAYGARRVVVIGDGRAAAPWRCAWGPTQPSTGMPRTSQEQILEQTDGRKFDVVVEATGNPAITRDILTYVRPRGRISMVGLFNSQKGEIDLDALVVNNITLKGSLGSPNVWDETLYLMQCGKIQAEPLITERRPLAETLDVFRLMEERQPDLIKAVLVP